MFPTFELVPIFKSVPLQFSIKNLIQGWENWEKLNWTQTYKWSCVCHPVFPYYNEIGVPPSKAHLSTWALVSASFASSGTFLSPLNHILYLVPSSLCCFHSSQYFNFYSSFLSKQTNILNPTSIYIFGLTFSLHSQTWRHLSKLLWSALFSSSLSLPVADWFPT